MQKKIIVTLIVTAVVMTGVIVGAVLLYDSLKESAPDDMLLQPPAGSQTGGAGSVGNTGDSGSSAGAANNPTGAPANQPDGSQSPTQAPTGQPDGQDSGQSGDGDDDRVVAPDFTVQDADGNEVMLSDLRGKPVVLNFWASWCPPCKEEMPYFNNVFEDLGDEVNFMMVCLTDGARETTKTGAAYVEEHGYTFPVYFDVSGEAGMTYGVQSIPATYFIDAEGYLVTRAEGGIPERTLRLGISYIMERN